MPPKESKEQRKQNLQYWNSFSLQKWYPLLKDFTFPTVFLPVSVEEAQAMLDYMENAVTMTDNNNTGAVFEMPPYNHPLLHKVEEKLDALIQAYVKQGTFAFVKLCDRSPKDACTERGRIQQFLQGPLTPLKDLVDVGNAKKNVSKWATNTIGLPLVYEAWIDSLRVSSGSEALRLILLSVHILENIRLHLEFKDDFWDLHFAVRQWQPDIHVENEFRGIVCNKQLNALSQYYYDCYFSRQHKYKDTIEKLIKGFWQTFKDKVPYDNYVVDFAFVGSLGALDDVHTTNNNKSSNKINSPIPIRIVELNPFDESTDIGLFSWKSHRDMLQKGPFTFRLNEKKNVFHEKNILPMYVCGGSLLRRGGRRSSSTMLHNNRLSVRSRS
jgi:hypothetical protein